MVDDSPFLQSPSHLEPHTDNHSPLNTALIILGPCKLPLAVGRATGQIQSPFVPLRIPSEHAATTVFLDRSHL